MRYLREGGRVREYHLGAATILGASETEEVATPIHDGGRESLTPRIKPSRVIAVASPRGERFGAAGSATRAIVHGLGIR